ncbi:hypothetical protein KGO95_01465 [Patescibacteria group bacterium]|nr:hypothetical protein [Patescibacteria group bacterium]
MASYSYNDAGQFIDRSKILISGHARSQFFDRVKEAYRFCQDQGVREKKMLSVIGAPRLATYEEADQWIRRLLNEATAHNAITKTRGVDAVLAYLRTNERVFYLRAGHWQFVITPHNERRGFYAIKTVLWLDDRIYQRLQS